MDTSQLPKQIQMVTVGPHLCSVATVTEDGRPWVRYIMGVGTPDLCISFATSLSSRKIAQIKKTPEVHVTCGVEDFRQIKPYVQIQAKAEILTDAASRHDFWMPPLEAYFSSPDNPDYAVVKLVPYRIEYLAIGAKTPAVLEV